MHLTLIQASETSFWNLTASLITSKSTFTQFWLVVIWLMEELLMTRKDDSATVNTVVKGTRQPSNHSSYEKQQFCRRNALVRAGKFRKGWNHTLQNQRHTQGEPKDKLAANTLITNGAMYPSCRCGCRWLLAFSLTLVKGCELCTGHCQCTR